MKKYNPIRVSDNFTDEYLIDYLKNLAAKLGRTPFGRDIDEGGTLTYAIYYKRFGSLITAQQKAGLAPTFRAERDKYTNEQLIAYIREMAEKLGHSPTIKEIKADGRISVAILGKRFRKFSKAVAAAGLIPNKSGKLKFKT